jgi:hypothetical protein
MTKIKRVIECTTAKNGPFMPNFYFMKELYFMDEINL